MKRLLGTAFVLLLVAHFSLAQETPVTPQTAPPEPSSKIEIFMATQKAMVATEYHHIGTIEGRNGELTIGTVTAYAPNKKDEAFKGIRFMHYDQYEKVHNRSFAYIDFDNIDSLIAALDYYYPKMAENRLTKNDTYEIKFELDDNYMIEYRNSENGPVVYSESGPFLSRVYVMFAKQQDLDKFKSALISAQKYLAR